MRFWWIPTAYERQRDRCLSHLQLLLWRKCRAKAPRPYAWLSIVGILNKWCTTNVVHLRASFCSVIICYSPVLCVVNRECSKISDCGDTLCEHNVYLLIYIFASFHSGATRWSFVFFIPVCTLDSTVTTENIMIHYQNHLPPHFHIPFQSIFFFHSMVCLSINSFCASWPCTLHVPSQYFMFVGPKSPFWINLKIIILIKEIQLFSIYHIEGLHNCLQLITVTVELSSTGRSRHIYSVFCLRSDNREQDDITQFGDHLWTQPVAQAKKGQGVCGAEFCPCWGEHRHHQRGPKDDRCIWYTIYGKLCPLKTKRHLDS